MFIPEVNSSFNPVMDIVLQGFMPDVLESALNLKAFDHLNTPVSAATFADKVGCTKQVGATFLKLLSRMNLIEENNGLFVNNPVARDFLVSTSPAFNVDALPGLRKSYGAFCDDLARKMTDHETIRDESDAHWATPEALESMGRLSLRGSLQDAIAFMLKLPGADSFKTMCDLGGNHGFFSMGMIDNIEGLVSTVCDFPEVTKAAARLYAEKGYEGKILTKPVDLRSDDSIGNGYDLAFASHILYGWVDDMRDLLVRVRESLTPGGWFVTNHMAEPAEPQWSAEAAFQELLAVVAGYPTHHLGEKFVVDAFKAAGFTDIRSQVSPNTELLLLAGRNPE